MYEVINESDGYDIIESGFKTIKEAKTFIKDLKRFDKEHGNPFNDNYIIQKED